MGNLGISRSRVSILHILYIYSWWTLCVLIILLEDWIFQIQIFWQTSVASYIVKFLTMIASCRFSQWLTEIKSNITIPVAMQIKFCRFSNAELYARFIKMLCCCFPLHQYSQRPLFIVCIKVRLINNRSSCSHLSVCYTLNFNQQNVLSSHIFLEKALSAIWF